MTNESFPQGGRSGVPIQLIGLIGAGSGASIGAAAAGEDGATLRTGVGGAVGAVGGLITTPPPRYRY